MVDINNNSGDILTCTAMEFRLWTINGDLIVSKQVAISADDALISAIFYEVIFVELKPGKAK